MAQEVGTRLGEREVLLREMPTKVMKRLLFVPFDQLNRQRGVLQSADPATDRIVFVQNDAFIRSRRWHRQRLFFLLSSARHFAEELRSEGFTVDWLHGENMGQTLRQHAHDCEDREIWATHPTSFSLLEALTSCGVQFVENDFFLTSRSQFDEWASSQKTFTMENFYRRQRTRLNLLMEGGKPVGGAWNFDADNRLPPPKNHHYEPPLRFESDDIDADIRREIDEMGDALWGSISEGAWATSRADALRQLAFFVDVHLAEFGPYEDAMPADSWAVHHSLLSPYLNNGMLLASEVVAAVISQFEKEDLPLSSIEGFVRQVIGWREYINGMYWYLGREYSSNNGLNATTELLPLFHDPESTQMNCMRSIVGDLRERAWVHHIPRLMVLSNLALLTGVHPREFLDWMRESFIDAADWVMVPNVIGMGVHADGGRLMTKPYAAGGAYISRMSNYCKSCTYNPKNRTGDDACPFTTLYWDFLDRHRDEFAKNHRMAQQVRGIDRLSDMAEVRLRARTVIAGLSAGEI